MAAVTLRYWAAAKEAAGVAEERVEASTLADALTAARAAMLAKRTSGSAERAERYALVLARSSFLINGDPVGTRPPESVTLPDDAVVEVLPPFAGG